MNFKLRHDKVFINVINKLHIIIVFQSFPIKCFTNQEVLKNGILKWNRSQYWFSRKSMCIRFIINNLLSSFIINKRLIFQCFMLFLVLIKQNHLIIFPYRPNVCKTGIYNILELSHLQKCVYKCKEVYFNFSNIIPLRENCVQPVVTHLDDLFRNNLRWHMTYISILMDEIALQSKIPSSFQNFQIINILNMTKNVNKNIMF